MEHRFEFNTFFPNVSLDESFRTLSCAAYCFYMFFLETILVWVDHNPVLIKAEAERCHHFPPLFLPIRSRASSRQKCGYSKIVADVSRKTEGFKLTDGHNIPSVTRIGTASSYARRLRGKLKHGGRRTGNAGRWSCLRVNLSFGEHTAQNASSAILALFLHCERHHSTG